MRTTKNLGLLLAGATSLALLSIRCGTEAPYAPPATGGTATGTGGQATGGKTGGSTTGGTATGGSTTGGTSTGGSATGGTATGGTATGGSSGSATGGSTGTGGNVNGGGGATGGGGAATGGGGGGGAGGAAPATFEQVVNILQNQCGICHYAGMTTPQKVNLRNGDGMLYTRLTTPITSANADKCNGKILVNKTTPSESLLSQAIRVGGVSDPANNCVIPQMPEGSTLNPADAKIINDWINAGAPQ